MSRWMKRAGWAALVCLTGAYARAAGAEEPGPKPKAKIDEAVRIQRNARNQLEALIKIMQNIVVQLEKTDPASARSLASAADRAQSALVTEDMEKVVQLLLTGMVVPADATQASILRRLREILEALRAGGDASLDARIVFLEKLQAIMAALQEIIRQQRVLERQSKLICEGPNVLPRFNQAAQQVNSLIARQRALMGKMDKLAVDEVQQKLWKARQAMQSQIGRVGDLLHQLAQPYPSPEQVAATAALHGAFQRSAISAFSDLKLLANDPAMAGVADELRAAASHQAQAVDEIAKSVEALGKDDLKAARVADAESQWRLKEALKGLQGASQKRATAAGTSNLVAEQEALTEEAGKLGKTVDELAPARAAAVVAAATGPGVTLVSPTGQALLGSPGSPVAPTPGAEAQPPAPQLDMVQDQATDAAGHIAAGNREAALVEQDQAVTRMENWLERLRHGSEEVSELVRNPDFPRQESDQRSITDRLIKIGTGEWVSPMPGDQKPGAPDLLREANVNVRRAGEHSSEAAKFLGQQKAPEANGEQNQVLSILETALANLTSECIRTASEVLEELSQQWIAALERALHMQKSVSADTIAVWQKRLPDGNYRRAEQLAFTALVHGEELVLSILDEMQDLMSKAVSAHSKVTFPPIVHLTLAMVRRDLNIAKNRLYEKDAGLQTQRLQKDIEERLEAMFKAMAQRDQTDLGQRPPLWGDNGVGNPDASNTSRTAELELMIVIQTQINRRTEEIEQMKKSGQPLPANIGEDYKELVRMEAEVRRGIRDMILKDLVALPGAGNRGGGH